MKRSLVPAGSAVTPGEFGTVAKLASRVRDVPVSAKGSVV